MAAHAAGVPRDLTMAVYARRMTRWQRDGHWVTSDFRPPHSSSVFTATATAIRAIQFYMPEERIAERDATIDRARRWLIVTRGASTEDAAFRLLGLAWAESTTDDRKEATRDLLERQQSGGGFPQLAGYAPDAYSTGEALFALHEAGMPASDPAWQKGAAFLISSQARDGSWHVRTRMLSPASISPPYFSTGFGYGKDEFLSYAGSCWAVMALAAGLADAPAGGPPKGGPYVPREGGPYVPSAPPGIRTALFGHAQAPAANPDRGLDPASKTEAGTTLLMMAAADEDKVRLLLARGLNPKQRATSGVDALTIAAAQFGTSPAIKLLLDAGAETHAPEGVRARHAPLVFAS